MFVVQSAILHAHISIIQNPMYTRQIYDLAQVSAHGAQQHIIKQSGNIMRKTKQTFFLKKKNVL